jgi:hypothetical protein
MVVLGTRKEKISVYSKLALAFSLLLLCSTLALDVSHLGGISNLVLAIYGLMLLTMAIVSARKLLIKMFASITLDTTSASQAEREAERSLHPCTVLSSLLFTTGRRGSSHGSLGLHRQNTMVYSIKVILVQVIYIFTVGICSLVSLVTLSIVGTTRVLTFYVICYFAHYSEWLLYLGFTSIIFKVSANKLTTGTKFSTKKNTSSAKKKSKVNSGVFGGNVGSGGLIAERGTRDRSGIDATEDGKTISPVCKGSPLKSIRSTPTSSVRASSIPRSTLGNQ